MKIDLWSEYNAIVKMYEKGKDDVPAPINAFFGNLLARPIRKKTYPFPIVRLGNMEKMDQALDYMRKIYAETKGITILEQNLERNKKLESQKLADTQQRHLAFYADLFDRQVGAVNKRQNELKEVSLQRALSLLPQDDKLPRTVRFCGLPEKLCKAGYTYSCH